MSPAIALVAPWYGEQIPGGAEAQARMLARTLGDAGIAVEVLTTCVRDFRSDWSRNFHPPGETIEAGVRVRRFPVRRRDTAAFDAVNRKLMEDLPVSAREEEIFLREMVNSPALYEYISDHRQDYVFIFIAYMFGTTYRGLQICPERSILIPCLHDESYARMQAFQPMMRDVRGVVFLSDAECALADRLFGPRPEARRVIGGPLDCDWTGDRERFAANYGLSDFLLYAGRTDHGKNAELLIEFFLRYEAEEEEDLKLVFIGGDELPREYRNRHNILSLGYLPLQDKYDCYAASLALALPSTRESFSIVLMESWLAGRPAIVHADCDVTTDFCRRSNGGLYFNDYEEFREIVQLLTRDAHAASALGEQGRRFVQANYAPEHVVARYLKALEDWGLVENPTAFPGRALRSDSFETTSPAGSRDGSPARSAPAQKSRDLG